MNADANVVFYTADLGLPSQGVGAPSNTWSPTGCTIDLTSGPVVHTTYSILRGSISTDGHVLGFDVGGSEHFPDGASAGLSINGQLTVGAAIDGMLELQLYSPSAAWSLTFVYTAFVPGNGPCATAGTFEATALLATGSGRRGSLDASQVCAPPP